MFASLLLRTLSLTYPLMHISTPINLKIQPKHTLAPELAQALIRLNSHNPFVITIPLHQLTHTLTPYTHPFPHTQNSSSRPLDMVLIQAAACTLLPRAFKLAAASVVRMAVLLFCTEQPAAPFLWAWQSLRLVNCACICLLRAEGPAATTATTAMMTSLQWASSCQSLLQLLLYPRPWPWLAWPPSLSSWLSRQLLSQIVHGMKLAVSRVPLVARHLQ